MATEDVNLHSIEVAGDKVWFTLANEAAAPLDRGASTFGYVSITSWDAGAPSGVLYNGLDTLGLQIGARRHSFRCIDVSPSGEVGLADMRGNALIRLTPV